MRDPANAALVNSDPELQQWVRNIKMSAEDMRSKMRNTAAPIFAKQVRPFLGWLLYGCCFANDCSHSCSPACVQAMCSFRLKASQVLHNLHCMVANCLAHCSAFGMA